MWIKCSDLSVSSSGGDLGWNHDRVQADRPAANVTLHRSGSGRERRTLHIYCYNRVHHWYLFKNELLLNDQYFINTSIVFFSSFRKTAFPFPYWLLPGVTERSSGVRGGGRLPAGERGSIGPSVLWHGDWWWRLDSETNWCSLKFEWEENGRTNSDDGVMCVSRCSREGWMGRRISTEPGVNTAPASETSARNSGLVKTTQQNLTWIKHFLANKSVKPWFLLFQETMFSTTWPVSAPWVWEWTCDMEMTRFMLTMLTFQSTQRRGTTLSQCLVTPELQVTILVKQACKHLMKEIINRKA